VNEPTRPEARLDVRPDDLLVLYTDGLVERRDESLDDGLRRLADEALGFRDEPVEEVANRLIERLVGTTASDDVALVVKRIHWAAGEPAAADSGRDAHRTNQGPRTHQLPVGRERRRHS
jgi:serine/threonine protein phosphatase PrpC